MSGSNFGHLSALQTTASTNVVSGLGSASGAWLRGFYVAPTTTAGTFAYHNGASSTTTLLCAFTVAASTQQPDPFAVMFPAEGFNCTSGLFSALTAGVNAITTIYST